MHEMARGPCIHTVVEIALAHTPHNNMSPVLCSLWHQRVPVPVYEQMSVFRNIPCPNVAARVRKARRSGEERRKVLVNLSIRLGFRGDLLAPAPRASRKGTTCYNRGWKLIRNEEVAPHESNPRFSVCASACVTACVSVSVRIAGPRHEFIRLQYRTGQQVCTGV